jgi:3-deoxy-7-phosphoheptulonate synthase
VLILLRENTNPSQIAELQSFFKTLGQESFIVHHPEAILAPNNNEPLDQNRFPFILEVKSIPTPFKLSSKLFKTSTEFDVNGILIGSKYANIIAGPCSIESEEQIFSIAEFLHQKDIKFIRGGAFKPRTSPYSFRGLGTKGLKLIREVADKYELSVVTELMDLSLLDEVLECSDIIQIGSRNMANFYMLSELGKINKPILLKRGMQANVTEWLLAADYILSGGNEKVILCERGIRSFDNLSRNVMDIGVIPLIQSLSHLPVFADPSHGTGNSKFVNQMAMAAMVAGANGLLVEIHPDPNKALSDGDQALNFKQFESLLNGLDNLKTAIQKPIDANYSLAIQ